jgi:hypothetical protein
MVSILRPNKHLFNSRPMLDRMPPVGSKTLSLVSSFLVCHAALLPMDPRFRFRMAWYYVAGIPSMATAEDTVPTLHSLQGTLPQGSPDCTAPGSMSMHYEAVPTWDHGQSNTLTRSVSFYFCSKDLAQFKHISSRSRWTLGTIKGLLYEIFRSNCFCSCMVCENGGETM